MEEHAHHSILHGLFQIGPIRDWIPQPSKQPDLILNTFFLIGLVAVFLFWTVRKVRRLPETTAQNLLEMVVEGLTGFFEGIIGEHGRKYIPFIASFFIFVLLLNLLGLIPGLQSPTADLNTTLGLALVAVAGVQIIAIRELGGWSYIRHFLGEPIWLGPIMLPLHLIGEAAKVMSLSIRLFGNIFGEDTIIVILAGLSPFFLIGHLEVPYLPIQLPMMFFGIFTSIVQALIFSVLTSIYLATFLEGHHDEGHH